MIHKIAYFCLFIATLVFYDKGQLIESVFCLAFGVSAYILSTITDLKKEIDEKIEKLVHNNNILVNEYNDITKYKSHTEDNIKKVEELLSELKRFRAILPEEKEEGKGET